MNKKSFAFLAFLFLAFNLGFSQQILNPALSVLPKDVFIGDKIEIRYSFTTTIKLLDTEQKLEIPPFEDENFTIQSIELTRTNSFYELIVFCVPWKSGEIKIPAINLSDYSADLSTDFIVKIPPIEVKSIVENMQKTQLQSIIGPLVIPGTTWIIYLLLFLALCLIVALFVFLANLQKFVFSFKRFLVSFKQKMNYRKTVKKLKTLNKNAAKYENKEFANELSVIIHSFLTTRFSTNFYATTSTQIPQKMNEMFEGLLPPEIVEQIDSLSVILFRLDFIRFSGVEDETADFSFVERSSVTNSLLDIFFAFEKNI